MNQPRTRSANTFSISPLSRLSLGALPLLALAAFCVWYVDQFTNVHFSGSVFLTSAIACFAIAMFLGRRRP